MIQFLRSGFTTKEGELDDARVSAFLLVLTFICNTCYQTYNGHAFDMQNFGIGAGALTAGLGAWFGIRKDN
jgi:hypothetical protein